MLNPYHERIDIQKIIDLQNYQYQNSLYLEQAVPANSQIDAAVNITALGHFMLLSFTGAYSTKDDGPVDDGINHLFFQLVDGSNQRVLFDDFIPANILLSPGREQIIAGAGNASEPLRLEFPFIYTFPLNSQIICRIRNDAGFENTLKIQFKGIRIFPIQRQQQ